MDADERREGIANAEDEHARVRSGGEEGTGSVAGGGGRRRSEPNGQPASKQEVYVRQDERAAVAAVNKCG